MRSEKLKSLFNLLRWIVIALSAAVIGTGLVRIFTLLLDRMQSGLGEISSLWGLPLPVWAGLGALITTELIYRFAPLSAGEGIPAYIHAVRDDDGRLPFKATISKFASALMTLGTFGIGGIVGPLGRVSAGLMSRFALLIHGGRAGKESRTAATCGMAAVVGAIFHSSIGGGIFAIEIIQRSSMNYRDLFPAIIASSGAVFLARSLGFAPFYPLPEIDAFMGPLGLPVVLAVGLLGGVAGLRFNGTYAFLSRRIRHNPRVSLRLKAIAGTTLTVTIAWLVQPELLGSSRELVRKLMFDPTALALNGGGALPLALVCIILLVLKSWGTSLTVGTGMSAGFVGPVVIMGMLISCAFCDLFGIPLISPLYYAALAAGFAATLASVMNVPIAAAIISLEIFGVHYGLPAALAAIIGFQINRSRTIYDLFPASAPGIAPVVD